MTTKAKLRVCASCEWIFKNDRHEEIGGCPKCGFAHYGARYCYGDKAYNYAKTQKPWKNKKLADYQYKLEKEISLTSEFKKIKNSNVFSLTARMV